MLRAHSVCEANRVLAVDRPDLTMVDLDLPGDAALSLIGTLRGTEVVAVVSAGSAQLACAAMAHGATSVLVKPTAVGQGVAASARRAPHGVLSDRELYALLLVAGGTPDSEVGQILGLTVNVAKTVLTRVKAKFGVRRREHLVGEAFRGGLLK
ncbi:hypothetical protein [Nocardia sp. NRRL S-836]|uniref:hypothetical protein n=1 Tax=Nocardia sp. NRRL S-836 TaxID=1519492 RepID=UPI0018D081C3|nr:hypothetical protein [Nocardia sp. NRRL S-836]